MALGVTSVASWGWIPTAAQTLSNRSAKATDFRLRSRVVPTAITRSTPAAAAATSTASSSPANWSKSKWACVSINFIPASIALPEPEDAGNQVIARDGQGYPDHQRSLGIEEARDDQ